ncbi:MAG TPA: GDSL-type esterase/lipase family protein [Elusimicrobiota bacterium]|nr:GDSL-type esterase/lipase family protein [Elusimicrobiota bacterium]
MKPVLIKAGLAFLSVLLVTVTLETAFRLAGVRYSSVPLSMEYVQWIASLGHTQNSHRRNFRLDYRVDPVYLWSPVPQPGITNSLGFLGPEWTLEKKPGVSRLFCLGDSCTISGEIPYPVLLQRDLDDAGPDRYEVFNAGVGSWSSYQGRLLFENLILRYRPDIVTVYFGWNDHWLAWSHPDKELSVYLAPRARWINLFNRSRLAQGMTWVLHRMVPAPDPRDRRPPLFRVPLEDYRANLEAIVDLAKKNGVRPVLITAPTTLHPRHNVVQYLSFSSRLFHDPNQINRVHSEYNAVVEQVARERGISLVPLANRLLYLPDREAMMSDGIHLSPEGSEWAARSICDTILSP